MSEKAEEFARQLLESTNAGKLKWEFVPDSSAEAYKSDAGDGLSFVIKRIEKGDDKTLFFELTESGRVALADSETNIDYGTNSELVREQAFAVLYNHPSSEVRPVSSNPKVKRFRLYSDLFYAARETAEGKDQAIEKAQQFLSRLAKGLFA